MIRSSWPSCARTGRRSSDRASEEAAQESAEQTAATIKQTRLPGIDRPFAIACPKLDTHQEIYIDKLVSMIDETGIRSLRVLVMEVPCCGGMVRIVEEALKASGKNIPLAMQKISIKGEEI